MNPTEFDEGAGEVEFYQNTPCFQPASLPPSIDYTDAILRHYGDAQRELGQVRSLMSGLTDSKILESPLALREAAMNSQLQGEVVSVDDIGLHFYGAGDSTGSEASAIDESINYLQAIMLGFDVLQSGGHIDRGLLSDLHQSVVAGSTTTDAGGQIRRSEVVTWGDITSTDNSLFIPANPETVPRLIDQWTEYIRSSQKPPLVDLALSLYQFEVIHPFATANRRMAQLVTQLQLFEHGLITGASVPLSAYFSKHQPEYTDKILAVSRDGAWEDWIEFVLQGIAEQAMEGHAIGAEVLELLDSYKRAFSGDQTILKAINCIPTELYLRPSRVKAIGEILTVNAAKDALSTLDDAEVVELIGTVEGERLYSATDIIDLISG